MKANKKVWRLLIDKIKRKWIAIWDQKQHQQQKRQYSNWGIVLIIEDHTKVYHQHDGVPRESQELRTSHQRWWALGRFRWVTEGSERNVSVFLIDKLSRKNYGYTKETGINHWRSHINELSKKSILHVWRTAADACQLWRRRCSRSYDKRPNTKI